jgi:outer membrane murein-binding lipoprotein Lpp
LISKTGNQPVNITLRKSTLAALIAGVVLPLGAQASEADLLKRIDAMAKEIELLRSQVQANSQGAAKANEELKAEVQKVADKSTGRWLTIGGDYQFRVDSMKGETKPFIDVNALFSSIQTDLNYGMMMGDPAAVPMIAGMMSFQKDMANVKTIQDTGAFFVKNGAMAGALMGIAQNPLYPERERFIQAAYKPKNDTLYTNRFNLDLYGKATQDVSVTAKLSMYKVWGSQNEGALTNAGNAPFFADRVGVFDGTLGRVPSNSYLNVDRVYATWSNIADQDMWFSVGRRPSTQGAPSNLKLNNPRPGNGGTPALLVDYAFDGMTFGYAPDIDSLPGAYGKVCYGRGFESGYMDTPNNSLKDTDMVGIALVPIDTDAMRLWLQWNRGMNIFDAPVMNNTYFGNTAVKSNLGNIDWYGIGVMGTVKNVGAGDLQYFADLGASVTHPNNNVSAQFGFQGLLTGGFFQPEPPADKTGGALWAGVRYDLPSKTKIGFEYNHGSKNWITFAPASGDMWTTKAGTRGDVYEAYVIQELNLKPISSNQAKTFVRFGIQVYDFEYTGSNNWVGAPVKISDVNGMNMMTTTPLSKAFNAYATAEVKF